MSGNNRYFYRDWSNVQEYIRNVPNLFSDFSKEFWYEIIISLFDPYIRKALEREAIDLFHQGYIDSVDFSISTEEATQKLLEYYIKIDKYIIQNYPQRHNEKYKDYDLCDGAKSVYPKK
jgi:hypothetical protein